MSHGLIGDATWYVQEPFVTFGLTEDDELMLMTYLYTKDTSTVCNTQNISLNSGWNIISSYINPTDPDMQDIFSNISGDILLVKNDAGQTFIPSLGINSIGTWMVEQGYMVKTINSTTLNIGCDEVNPTVTPISLNAGWNIIAYLRTTPMAINNALGTVLSDVLLVKDGYGNSYIPILGINGIGNMQPGQGYKIKLNNATSLTYPPN